MLDEFNADRTGWARFSDDHTMRFRLARSLDGRPLTIANGIIVDAVVATFTLLNPSVADAFRVDNTFTRGIGFAKSWGCNVVQFANAFALRSTDPDVLYEHPRGCRGDGPTNDYEIADACTSTSVVVAAWGVHGALDNRGTEVRWFLSHRGVDLYHLGLTKAGHPKHILYLKGTTSLTKWTNT